MSSPFLAEIRIFACNFAPTGWTTCDGQLLPISQNTALFSLLGTIYGGNGKSNFALPNLNGSVPTHAGANQPGPGLQYWDQGQSQGTDYVTLTQSEIPVHPHALVTENTNATTATAGGNQLAKALKGNIQASNNALMYSTGAPNTQLAPIAVGVAGGDQPHNNLMPYLALIYCIALQGVFPPRQ